jgi:predicted TIM-barrel fold metal-dependent hydrolase
VLRENNTLPCMIHTNEPVGQPYSGKTPITLEQIYTLAKTFPDNRIILAHWGGGILFYNIMKKQTKEILKNIWYDTAASPFLFDPQIYDMAATAGVIEKVLFGTDFPLLTPDRYYKDLDNSNITTQQKELILGRNAVSLFG